MIYITGNTHGDINRFETEQTKKFTSEDYLIICGDFGFIWNGGKKEEKQLERLSQRLSYQTMEPRNSTRDTSQYSSSNARRNI